MPNHAALSGNRQSRTKARSWGYTAGVFESLLNSRLSCKTKKKEGTNWPCFGREQGLLEERVAIKGKRKVAVALAGTKRNEINTA